MLTPLRCLVVHQAAAVEVISPAYDALTPLEREEVARQRPRSWLNVTASPVRPDQRSDDPALIESNRRALESLLGAGVFREVGPALFLYRLDVADHSQTAIVGELPVAAATDGRLVGHESSHPDRVEGLAANLARVAATSSPVAATWRGPKAPAAVVTALERAELLIDATVPGDVRQRVWAVSEAEDIDALASAVTPPPLFIVDGHHRTAAAVYYRANHPARSPFDDQLLVAAFPSEELRMASFHRLVRMDDTAAAWWAHQRADATGTRPGSVRERSVAVVGPDGRWLQLDLPDGDELDVNLLQRQILEGELGVAIGDQRLTYVPGNLGLAELERRARQEDALGFALAPPPLSAVLDIAEAGRTMPPKATFFHPKVRSGVFVRLHDPADRALLR